MAFKKAEGTREERKLKFDWKFEISEDQQFLEIHLNGGFDVGFEIYNEKFYELLSDKMTEIMHFQYVLGYKTKVININAVHKAVAMKNRK
jgi:uncharacterized membrane protein